MPHRLALLLLAALAAWPCAGQPASRPARNILVLHSYQEGPEWVHSIDEGISSVFAAETRFEAVFRYEHMNVLDSDPADYPQVYGLRLGRLPFDLVLCVDDPALEFVLANRDRYFRGVPVVFCAVENFSARLLEGSSGITGVTEEQDLESTLWLALRMHPETRRVIMFVNRRIVAERAAYRRLQRLIRDELAPGLDVRFWEDPPLQEVLRLGPRAAGRPGGAGHVLLPGRGRPAPAPGLQRPAGGRGAAGPHVLQLGVPAGQRHRGRHDQRRLPAGTGRRLARPAHPEGRKRRLHPRAAPERQPLPLRPCPAAALRHIAQASCPRAAR